MIITLRRINRVLDLVGLVAVLWIPDEGEPGWTSLRFQRGSYSANCNDGVRAPIEVRVWDAFGPLEDPEPRAQVRTANDPKEGTKS